MAATQVATDRDRGWAWAVLFGAHLSVALSNGYIMSLGVFYIEWKDYFDTNATNASWLMSMPMLVASPLCFFIGILASRVGIRRVSMVGAAVTGLATILGSRASNITQLYICNGVAGVGSVMTVSPGTIIISQYFKKRYVLANGIVVLGLNVGQMVFPLLIRVLIANYGWRGAMFIIGAVQMNGVAACALFRPLKTNSDNVPHRVENVNGRESDRRSVCSTLPRYLHIFTNVKAMLILLASSFYFMAAVTNLFHLPARSKEVGWSDDKSAMLVFTFGLISMVTRAVHGWFVDRNYVGSFSLQLVVILGAAVTSSLNPVSDSYGFLVAYTVLVGAFLGVGTPLLIVNTKIVASASDVPAALSLIWACIYLFSGVGTAVAGMIHDVTGNYAAPFLTAGAMFLLAFLLLALVTAIKKREDRRLKLDISNAVQCQTAADECEDDV